LQTLLLPNLPFLKVLFLKEDALVAVGYDFNPMIFSKQGDKWVCNGKVDGKQTQKKTTTNFGVRSAFEKFQTKASIGQHTRTQLNTRHKNTINSIQPVTVQGGKVTKFSTSGLDGRILYWNTADCAKAVEGFQF
jgi:actin related protein 2/3 complex subunit 1A/1B